MTLSCTNLHRGYFSRSLSILRGMTPNTVKLLPATLDTLSFAELVDLTVKIQSKANADQTYIW